MEKRKGTENREKELSVFNLDMKAADGCLNKKNEKGTRSNLNSNWKALH